MRRGGSKATFGRTDLENVGCVCLEREKARGRNRKRSVSDIIARASLANVIFVENIGGHEIRGSYRCRLKVVESTGELSCSFAARDFALVITGLPRCARVAFSTAIHPAFASSPHPPHPASSLSVSLVRPPVRPW